MRFVLFLLWGSLAFGATKPGAAFHVREVTPLNPAEAFQALLFHADRLWVGKSVDKNHKVELYSADGARLITSIPLVHTAEFIYAFGPDKALVVGKTFTNDTGWRTFYSILMLQGDRLQANTTIFPIEIQTEQFAGTPTAMFFNLFADEKVFRWENGAPHYLKLAIPGPGRMAYTGTYLFVTIHGDIKPGQDTIVRYDLKTEYPAMTFHKVRNQLEGLVALNGYPMVAVSEARADLVHLIDIEKNEAVKSLPVAGGPWDLTQLGHCLVSMSVGSRHLRFFDLKKDEKLVADWDVGKDLGAKFLSPRTIQADPKTGRIFVRAPWRPELPGAETGVKVIEPTSSEVFDACR